MVGGGFAVHQSFQGKLSGVNVWDHVLTSNKIKEMSTTCVLNEEDNGNVYNWVDILREGAIRFVEPSTCEPMGKGMCGFKISTFVIWLAFFPSQRAHSVTSSWSHDI